MEEVNLGHHRDRSDVPGWGRLFFAGNLLLRVTPLAFSFVGLDPGEMGSKIVDVHRSPAAWLGARQMLMLQGLDESTVRLAFLF